MPSRLTAAGLTVLAAAALAGTSAAFQTPRLETVLRRCAEYVADYEPRISRVVAHEEYLQKLTVEGQPGDTSRRLVSDFLFLRLPGERGSWMGIRDVREVDGEAVPTGTSRLATIAGASSYEIERLAEELAHENARYNLDVFVRTVNVPLIVLSWLHSGYRGQFAFKHAGVEEMDGTRAWRVEFRERGRPTIIRTPEPERKEVVSRGTVWVEPDTGRVLQTELRTDADGLQSAIRVRFRWYEPLGIMVPESMRERLTRSNALLDGDAKYTDFRRFDVTTRIK